MDNISNSLNLLATNMCSPLIIYIVFVILICISLYMTRTSLKKYNTDKMDTLFNFHFGNEVKMLLVMGVVIYGLCQYNQVNLAWIFLIFPVIYVVLKNILIFIPVSSANQNAPTSVNVNTGDILRQVQEADNQQKIIQQQQRQNESKDVIPAPSIVNKEIGGLGGSMNGGYSPPLNSSLGGMDMMNGGLPGF